MRRPRSSAVHGIGGAALTLALGAGAAAGILNLTSPEAVPAFIAGSLAVAGCLALVPGARRLDAARSSRKFARALANLGMPRPDDESGADLYKAPWYVVLGPIGSGKSAVIRRLGGRAPMMSWRLNPGPACAWNSDAVFIETPGTAGVEASRELLAALRNGRPHLPISGALLCIPADTLVLDAPGRHAPLGATIAEQLKALHEATGVRFPVYILATRCDRLLGFREAAGMRPAERDAPLGWCNPAPPDAAFTLQSLDQAIAGLMTAVHFSRGSAMAAPAQPGEIDAVYALPDSVQRLGRRLRAVLEPVCSEGPGPWFIRGVYLGAAACSGPVIDPDLPLALAGWEQPATGSDQSAFLERLLAQRLLPESSLVTPRPRTRRAQIRRRRLTAAASLATIASAAAAAAFAPGLIRGPAANEVDLWQRAAASLRDRGGTPGEILTLAERILEGSGDRAGSDLIARVASRGSQTLAGNREAATSAYLRVALLRPAFQFAAKSLAQVQPGEWTAGHTAALAQLVRLCAGTPADPTQAVADLLHVSMEQQPLEPFLKRLRALPPAQVRELALASAADLGPLADESLQAFTRHWASAVDRGELHALAALNEALAALTSAEGQLQAAAGSDDAGSSATDALIRIREAVDRVDTALKAPGIDPGAPDVVARAASSLVDLARQEHEALLSAVPESSRHAAALRQNLAQVEQAAQACAAPTAAELAAQAALSLSFDPTLEHPYRLRARLYAAVASAFIDPEPSAADAFGAFEARIGIIERRRSEASRAVDLAETPATAETAAVLRRLIQAESSRAGTALIRAATESVRLSRDEFLVKAARLAERDPGLAAPPFPSVALSAPPSLSPEPAFSPRVAERIFADWAAIASITRTNARGLPAAEVSSLIESLQAARGTYSRYAEDYVRYWTATIPAQHLAPAPMAWHELSGRLAPVKPAQINAAIRSILQSMLSAVAIVPSELGQDTAIARARTNAAAQFADMDRPWFDDACRRTRDKWAALSPDPGTARAALVRLAQSRFEADFLEIYSESGGVGFWNSLVFNAVTSLADAHARTARAEAQRLVRETFGFPLCADGDPAAALSEEEIFEARRQATKLIRGGLSAMTDERGRTITQGAQTGFAQLNVQLARLVSGEAFSGSEQTDQWAHKLRAVLAFLGDESPQACTISVLPGTPPSSAAASDPQAPADTLLQVAIGNGPWLAPLSLDCPGDRGVTFQFPGPDVRLRLVSRSGEVYAAPLDLAGPWSVVAPLVSPGAVLDELSDVTGRTAQVPLTFTDTLGRHRCVWVALTFERQPPALAEWRDREDWPQP